MNPGTSPFLKFRKCAEYALRALVSTKNAVIGRHESIRQPGKHACLPLRRLREFA
jgi:hypothetical protein